MMLEHNNNASTGHTWTALNSSATGPVVVHTIAIGRERVETQSHGAQPNEVAIRS